MINKPESPKYLVLICARGGSKGVPKKNIRKFGGKPLIAWPIDTALKLRKSCRVVVSTDSEEIAEVAAEHGAEVPFMRPEELAQDTSPEWLVWQHALKYFRNQGWSPEALIVLPATAPLRAIDDVERCIEIYESEMPDGVITASDASRNPYFNMVSISSNGRTTLVNKPDKPIYRRQDAPEVFDMTTVAYVMNPEFILRSSSLFEGDLRTVVVPSSRSLDIDTELDFQFGEFLLSSSLISE